MTGKKLLWHVGLLAGALVLVAACTTATQTRPTATRTTEPAGTTTLPAEFQAQTESVTPLAITPTIALSATPSRQPMATLACDDSSSRPQCRGTPWPTATSTVTPIALPPPATAAPGASAYRLKPWTEADAGYAIALMRAYAAAQIETQGYAMPWITDTVALPAQEALLRFPNWPGGAELRWDIARWLVAANGGSDDRRATNWLAALIETGLNDGSLTLDTLPAQLNAGRIDGTVQARVIPAANLFGDGQTAYVLSLDYAFQGAAFSIGRATNNQFMVQPLANDWAMHFAAGFQVDVSDHNRNGIPEITIEHAEQPGSNYGYATVHVLEWQHGQWRELLNPPELRGVFLGTNDVEWRYVTASDQTPDELILNSPLDPYMQPVCVLRAGYFFDWNGASYQLNHVGVAVPDSPASPMDLVCGEDAMAWAEAEHTYTDVIPFMGAALQNWPPLDQDSTFPAVPMETVKQALGPGYQDYYRLQLGRFYALAGQEQDASVVLQALINKPAARAYPLWPTLARSYLKHLPDVNGAESAFKAALRAYPNGNEPALGFGGEASTEWRLHWQSGPVVYAEKLAVPASPSDSLLQAQSQAEADLFIRNNPVGALTALSIAASPQWQCDDSYSPHNCGRVLYLLGLAYELHGDTAQAVEAYWRAWHGYPDNAYALMAQAKLESTR